MKQYLNLATKVLTEGKIKSDRTNTGTISFFGSQTKYNLENGLPIITTKKINFVAIIHELLWFIKGDTNIKYLVDNNVNIWNEWPFQIYQKSSYYQNESLSDFVLKIKNNPNFASKHGDLGPVYGKQWRNFNGVDQLEDAINLIKNDPDSRRIIISSWNPGDIKKMALPPCHAFFQFYVQDKYLSLQLYQRSGDIFLGVPFNITSYSVLLSLIAHHCNLTPKDFIHTIGDNHLYLNHLDQIKIQLKREPKTLPTLIIKNMRLKLEDYVFEDFELFNYEHDSPLKGKVAV